MNPLAIGIDIGGTNTKAGLVDLTTGEVKTFMMHPTETKDESVFFSGLSGMIRHLQSQLNPREGGISGIGIGVSSFVSRKGLVDSTYGFQEFMEDYPLASKIEEGFGIPCRVDNDARVVALGEALYGAGRNYDRVLVLTLGTGLGIGFVAGKKFESEVPYGHMSGHISVGDSDVVCYCGKRACLESLVSATGIINQAVLSGWTGSDGKSANDVSAIFRAGEEGDPLAASIVNGFIRALRTGIDNYINIFAPDLIILGGGVAKGMGRYLPQLLNTDTLKPYKSYQVAILQSTLSDQSGVLGSAALFTH